MTLIIWLPVVILVYVLLVGAMSRAPARSDAPARALPFLLGTFLVVYGLLLLASVSVLAQYIPLEERYLLPVYVVAVILGFCVVTAGPRPGRLVLRALLLVLAAAVTSTVWAGAAVLREGERSYPGFAASLWKDSDGMQEITDIPQATRIYSNFPEAIYHATGRPARLLPKRILPGGHPNATYAERLSQMEADVRSGAVVVYFTIGDRHSLPSPADLRRALGSDPPKVLFDALVFRHPPS